MPWLILAVTLGVIGLCLGAVSLHLQRQARAETVRFRLHVWATEPDRDGLRNWNYEVLDEGRLMGSQVVVSGTCVSWRRALEDGEFHRRGCEEGYRWSRVAREAEPERFLVNE